MEKKEITMEARLLLAFLLMGLVLFGTQYFYKPAQPPPKGAAQKADSPNPANPASKTNTSAPTPPPAAPAPAADMPGQIHADKEETFTVETDLYKVTFSNRG